MRIKPIILAATALVAAVASIDIRAAQARPKPAVEHDYAVREVIDKSFDLAADGTVEVSGIAGPVEIETSSGRSAEVHIVRSAPTKEDLDCGAIEIDANVSRLSIHSESLCNVVRTRQRVTLKVPRTIGIHLRNVAGNVRIADTDGKVKLDSIAGSVRLAGVRDADLSSLAGGITMTITDVGERGIHLSSVTGGVDLDVRDNVDADLSVSSIVGQVRSDSADVRIRSNDDDSDYEAVIGSGGNKIQISSVVGTVTIRSR